MKSFFSTALLTLFISLQFISCKQGGTKALSSSSSSSSTSELATTYPEWIKQSNIYEVNVRQYTPEGTFKAFEASLPRLKEMGVEILWFMPINPISIIDRKGKLGSYYAVADYTAINPEFGTLDDWKALVKKAHDMGFKIIIDWVPNHSGADHKWLNAHKDFYLQDSTGTPKFAFDWSDTRELNYDSKAMKDSMVNAMKFWLTETNIDGFRCDVAAEVPRSFWQPAITELKKVKPDIFMLAEADNGWLQDAGFHATYAWDYFAMMKKVANGSRPAFALDSVMHKQDESFLPGAVKMFFTSNHDENSWNKSDYATFPGEIHAPFAVYTQTMRYSLPLIYSGQEEPFLDSLSFFYKDTITWGKYQRASFYKTLLGLRKANKALATDGSFKKMKTGVDDKVYAYLREKDGQKVLVVLNFSKDAVEAKMNDAAVNGQPENVFVGKPENVDANTPIKLAPWGYVVYSYK